MARPPLSHCFPLLSHFSGCGVVLTHFCRTLLKLSYKLALLSWNGYSFVSAYQQFTDLILQLMYLVIKATTAPFLIHHKQEELHFRYTYWRPFYVKSGSMLVLRQLQYRTTSAATKLQYSRAWQKWKIRQKGHGLNKHASEAGRSGSFDCSPSCVWGPSGTAAGPMACCLSRRRSCIMRCCSASIAATSSSISAYSSMEPTSHSLGSLRLFLYGPSPSRRCPALLTCR